MPPSSRRAASSSATRRAAGVVLELEDDGVGFASPADGADRTGWACSPCGARRGGRRGVRVFSQPGRGVLVRVTIAAKARLTVPSDIDAIQTAATPARSRPNGWCPCFGDAFAAFTTFGAWPSSW